MRECYADCTPYSPAENTPTGASYGGYGTDPYIGNGTGGNGTGPSSGNGTGGKGTSNTCSGDVYMQCGGGSHFLGYGFTGNDPGTKYTVPGTNFQCNYGTVGVWLAGGPDCATPKSSAGQDPGDHLGPDKDPKLLLYFLIVVAGAVGCGPFVEACAEGAIGLSSSAAFAGAAGAATYGITPGPHNAKGWAYSTVVGGVAGWVGPAVAGSLVRERPRRESVPQSISCGRCCSTTIPELSEVALRAFYIV